MRVSTNRQNGVLFTSMLGLVGGLAIAFASAWAQAPARKPAQQPRPKVEPPTQTTKTYRYAPSLAILMAAYEGVEQNNEQANPEIVKAMRKSFQNNPSARQTMAKVHTAYRALSPSDREKIVGKELATANVNTRLTRAKLDPILRKQFKRKPPLLAERASARVDAAAMKPVVVPDRELLQDPETKSTEQLIPLKERFVGAEPKEGNSTRYRVEYKGLYCRQEPADPGLHCEPYVIFTMKQGDSQWTRRKGPYEHCDSGDKFRETMTLRSSTPFGNDLDVVATVFEHDLGSIEEIEDAIQTGVDTLASIVDIWWETPDWLEDAVTEVVTWFADLFSLQDDQIGSPQSIRFTKTYAERHTSHNTWEGIEYDTYLDCSGDPHGRRNQRGDFHVFLDVRPLP